MTGRKKKAATKPSNDEERPEEMKGLTPYQGKERTIGHFECSECNHTWVSANSYADMGQDCFKCKINVYPHKQELHKTKGRTPYQGLQKAFGLFECDKCGNSWASAHTWAEMGQDCLNCGVNVYPYVQWELQRNKNKKKDEKEHLTNLCEKCKSINGDCRKLNISKKSTTTTKLSKNKSGNDEE